MVGTTDQVFALLDAGKDVAGAVYPLKRLDWAKIASHARAGMPNLKSASLDYVVDFAEPASINLDENFVRVRQIGTGFLMIQRSVFERMATHYPELKFNGSNLGANSDLSSPNTYAFFDTMIEPETGTYLSEDYAFCRRWIDMGGDIWANSTSRLTHIGGIPFEGDLRAMLETLRERPEP